MVGNTDYSIGNLVLDDCRLACLFICGTQGQYNRQVGFVVCSLLEHSNEMEQNCGVVYHLGDGCVGDLPLI